MIQLKSGYQKQHLDTAHLSVSNQRATEVSAAFKEPKPENKLPEFLSEALKFN